MRDDFNFWLCHEKYTALLTIVCTLFPLLQNIDFSVKERCPFCAFLLEHSYDLANIFFLQVTLVMLVNTDFLINRDEIRVRYCWFSCRWLCTRLSVARISRVRRRIRFM